MWDGHCQVLCLSLHRLGVSRPTVWVVFPGFGPTTTLKPNLKLRGSTSPCRLLRKDDYSENQFRKDHLRLIFTSSSCVKTVPPGICSLRVNPKTQRKSRSMPALQRNSNIPLEKQKRLRVEEEVPWTFGCLPWVGVPKGSHHHQNPVADLERARWVIRCTDLLL